LELLRKVDLSGFIAVGKAGVRGLALVVRMPADVVELALRAEDGLLADGCLVEVDGGLMMPNYVEAQSARSSDKQRKQEQRSRDAAARLQSGRIVTDGDENGRDVTPGDQTGQPVTNRDSTSQNVTDSHTPSPAVTDGHSVLSCTVLSCTEHIREGAPAKAGNLQGAEHAPAAPSPVKVEVLEPPSETPDDAEIATEVKDAGKAPKRASNRGSRCPSSVSPEAGTWCHGIGLPDPGQTPELRKMLDHFAAAPGAKGVKADWLATWRNWSTRAAEFSHGSSRGPVRSVQPSTPRTTMSLDEYVNSPANHQGDF
jgi:hypothetical protein